MKPTTFIFALVIALIAASCASPNTPPAPTLAPILSIAVVQSVEVQILNSQPLQANAVVHGQLPDSGCTTIASADQEREGNIFHIALTTTTDPLALCSQVLTPFEQVIPLNVWDLPPARYTVTANGIEKSFKLLTQDDFQFKQALVDALNRRNYNLLKVLMDQSLMIGYLQSEGTTNSPEAAIEQLQANLLNASAPIVADHRKNLIELLGMDPLTIIGPSVVEASPLFTTGWGPEGKDEAILFVAKLPDGGLYWYGMLFAKDGFKQPVTNSDANPPANPPQSSPPAPRSEPVPTITILGVVKDSSVTIRTLDYPVNVNFKVRMGLVGTGGIDGIVVDTINSRRGGSLTATFEIPPKLYGEKQIAIRLESQEGFYSYNWFDNTTSWEAANSIEPLPTNVKYVVARQDISVYDGPSKNYKIISSIAEGQTTQVTGVSLDGNWWRVLCPNNTVGSCWVLAKPKFTKPTD